MKKCMKRKEKSRFEISRCARNDLQALRLERWMNPQMLRRMAWRCALHALPMFLAFLFLVSAQGWAGESTKLVSKEGEMKADYLKLSKELKGKYAKFEKNFPDQDPVLKDLKDVPVKYVKGRVSGAGFNGVGVECFLNDEKTVYGDMWFNYDKGVKIKGMKSLAELKQDDTVSVGYKESKDGRRILTDVQLIKKKPKEAEVKEPASDE